MKTPNYGKRKIVITADESCMHNHNMSFMAGFLSCVPRDTLPGPVKRIIEKKFFSYVPHTNGEADVAILALRKIEAYLREIGYNDIVVATPHTAPFFTADIFLVSTMDPFGIGPATTTMLGLAGGKEPFNKYFFQRLMERIRKNNPNAKIVVGGPGAWEFNIFPEKQKELGINCVFEGAIEALDRNFFENLARGTVPEKLKTNVFRPKPRNILGPSFWGLVEISRGCGRGCQFCDFELMSGFDWMPRDFILKDAETNARSPLTDNITLLSEDILRYGTPRGQWKPSGDIVDLVKELSKLGKPLGFSHCCLTSALSNKKVMEDFSYYAGLDEKNLSGFQVGIESGSPRIMQRYMKGKILPWTAEEWPEVVKQGMAVMIDNYVIPHATLVMGLAEETPNDTIKTIELVEYLKDYPSLILPLFFVPLSVIKDRFFIADMMTSEQKELLMITTKHTANWAKKLPNWSGSLPLLDRMIFVGGAEYSFAYLDGLQKGDLSKKRILGMVVKSGLKAFGQILRGPEQKLDYYNKTKREYPIVETLPTRS